MVPSISTCGIARFGSSTRTGGCVREQRVVTSRERLVAAFAGLGPMRILLETGTESEWVAQALEAAGHTVIVADPELRADVWRAARGG